MKKQKALKLLRGATAACALLTTVSIGAATIANEWASFIDAQLGTTHTKVVSGSAESDSEENLYTYINDDITSTTELISWHKDLAERMTEEGAVLLKNTTSNSKGLPLAAGSKVTLLGIRSVNPVYGGTVGSVSNTKGVEVDYVTALKEKGFDVNETVSNAYSKINVDFGSDSQFGAVKKVSANIKSGEVTVDEVKSKESGWDTAINNYKSGTAIVVVGRPSSEASSYYPGADGLADSAEFESGANFLGLSINEKAIIDYACNTFSNVVVVVNSSSAMELEYAKQKEGVSSIVWIGDPGTYGLLGLADVLKGTVSPSGHLPDTYAVNSASSPAMVNFGLYSYANYEDVGDTGTYYGFAYLDEAEGIYTGYRYYETRYEDSVLDRYNANSAAGAFEDSIWDYDKEVSYTFGYGLSYTTFTQEIVPDSFSDSDGKISVQVKVTNTGSVAGKDVVQVYVQTPYTQYDIANHVEKSAIQLADFEKTSTLAPGADEIVTITFDKKYIASYDYVNAKTYILDAGDYYLALGNGAHEAINNVLKAKGASVDGDADKTYKWTYDELDKTTYSTSNGTDITNRLDDMNLNYWTGDKTKLWEGQLSRSDWSGTWPKGYTYTGDIRATSLVATSEMIKELKNEVYDDIYAAAKDYFGTGETQWGQNTGLTIGMMKGASYDDERWDDLLSTITLDEAINFYCNGNASTEKIDTIYLSALKLGDGPLGFENSFRGNQDKEGNPARVSKSDPNYGYDLRDGALECLLGASFNKELLYEYGRRFGTDALWTNQIAVWGVGLNTHRTPYNARNHEYFSEDSMLSNYLSAEFTKGAQSLGLIVAVKHLAFNDQETNRYGASVFMNEQRAREIELRAFQGAFVEGGATGVMTAYNRVGVRYAGAHQGLMTNILRNEWGFKGYNITDMINGNLYMRSDNALLSGTTILCTSNDKVATGLVEAVKNDNVIQNALKDALHNNLWAIVNSNAMNGISASSKTVNVIPWWEAALISAEVIFGVLTGAALVGYVLVTVLKKNDEEAEVANNG